MKRIVECVTISHDKRFNFKHVSRYFFSHCQLKPWFLVILNDVATIVKATPQANDDFIDFNRKPNHTFVIFYYSSNISIFFKKEFLKYIKINTQSMYILQMYTASTKEKV